MKEDEACDVFVVHYHEIGLKGRNRRWFEERLASNIRRALEDFGPPSVRNVPGRIVVEIPSGAEIGALTKQIERVFGVSHFSPAVVTEPKTEALLEQALHLADLGAFSTFEVRARKGYTNFPERTQRINELVGHAIREHTGARVDLDNPQWSCHIELAGANAFVYSRRFGGPGGLPVGVSGRVLALLSGGIDSPVAAWEIAKRGAKVDLIHFHGQPFADPSSERQARALAAHLAPWLARVRLWLVPFGEIQSEIVTSSAQELRVVLYRRFMARIAEGLGLREGAEALVTGESLGQVASQTLPNITAVDQVVERLPVLRPLIGRDKIEIESRAKEIGTYEISIQPHQDCCVLFAPRRVTTRAQASALADAESNLDVPDLVAKGVGGAELVKQ